MIIPETVRVMAPPAVLLMATVDPRLHPRDVHILIHLHTFLDVGQWRLLKQSWLSHRLKISQPEVCRGLRRLRDRGYIERSERRTYRATLSPLPTQDEAARLIAL